MKKHELISKGAHPAGLGGTRAVYKCANGYGASVIRTPFSYGHEDDLYEVGVLKFNDEDDMDGDLVYTELCGDMVVGHLTWMEVVTLLNAIGDNKAETWFELAK